MKLSDHFTLEELANTSHSDYLRLNATYARKNISKLRVLAKTILEPCRAISGPLIVTSGVRCPELNKKVGGAATSQHCLCEAADLVPVRGMTPKQLFEAVRKTDIPFGQLILEEVGGKCWLHISLGEPYRDRSKCRQVLKYNGKKYEALEW